MQMEVLSDQDRGFSTRMRSLAATTFLRADVLRSKAGEEGALPTAVDALRRLDDGVSVLEYDILISNPPYISSKAFQTTTARSVRLFEPKLALVPCRPSTEAAAHDGDVFYPRLLHLAEQLSTKIVLFEVADMDQAQRVASLAVKQGIWDGIEIWRDEPGTPNGQHESTTVIDGAVVKVRGAGHGRSVFAYRGAGTTWAQ
ncbi:hypothetical protein LTR85_006569 [Meristemomyces frigidus]|nr:hypothetical protein LTR85_006569 [Meristemomyces frigidus]